MIKLGEIKRSYVVVPFSKWNKTYFNTLVTEDNIYDNPAVAKDVAQKLSNIGELYSVYSSNDRRLIF